jgi:hypothetical protein
MAIYNGNLIPGVGVNVTLAQVDDDYDPQSDNAQSGKAVAKAVANAGGSITVDQIYNGKSENAQSGKAVAQAVNGRIPKIITEGHTVGFKRVIALQEGIAGEPLGTDDEDYVTVGIAPYDTAELPSLYDEIATYGNGGRLCVNTPIKDFDCANKGYVDDAVSKISGLKITVVAELPQTGKTDTLYFVPSSNSQEQNLYDEYIYANGAWEKIGSASVEVDLTDYVKNTDYATNSVAGIVKTTRQNGLGVKTDGTLFIDSAGRAEILQKHNQVNPIVPYNLDYAVKVGLTTNAETLTDEEKAAACGWLGAVGSTDYATATKGGVVKTSGTYCIRDIGEGRLACVSLTYEQYITLSPYAFISKGTLDNVLAEKIGDIETLLGGI